MILIKGFHCITKEELCLTSCSVFTWPGEGGIDKGRFFLKKLFDFYNIKLFI